jgi:multidrug resistance efflux pump
MFHAKETNVASDENVSKPDVPAAPEAAAKTGNPLRRIAFIITLLAAILFVLSIFMERQTPSSSQAIVQAYVVGIAPEVTGRVIEIGVDDNSAVAADQVLFRIDPSRYQIAVDEAEARLANVGQSIGASVAEVDTAQAKVVEARVTRDNKQDFYARSVVLVQKGVYSKAKSDDIKLEYDQAEATLTAAEADLVRAQQELGSAGSDNPRLKEALAQLERAQLDLLRTTVIAPSAGVVTNLQLAVGKVVSAGQQAMTFIDVGTVWIAAAFKENSLERVTTSNRAEVLFDTLPGRIFNAKVESIGLGISQMSTDPATGLPKIRTDTGWVKEAQLFPIRLTLDDGRPKGVRYGSQATVVIYTGDNPVTNAWGWAWIRIMSVLTYVG